MHHFRRFAVLSALTVLIGCAGEEATEPAATTPAPGAAAPADATSPSGEPVGTATQDMGGSAP